MTNSNFNEWAYLPTNLTAEQVANPLLVLEDFFSSDWLPGHIEHLHQWRESVLADAFFVDAKGNPAQLLTSFKLNIALIEACYELSIKIKTEPDNFKGIAVTCVQQLEKEKNQWLHYPELLSQNELLNPFTIIEQFFEAFSLPEYRGQLNEWLDSGLSRHSAGKFIETADIIAVYENLQKLYSAAWLIHQRTSNDPYLKNEPKATIEAFNTKPTEQNLPHLYKLNTIITAAQHEQIGQIVIACKEKVTTIQSIIYLGIPPAGPNKMYLLVLTDNNKEQRLSQEISNTLEDCCRKIADVTILAHHAARMTVATEDRNLLFKRAADCPVLYLSGGLILPKQSGASSAGPTQATLYRWQRWYVQSSEFLKGAEYYLTIGAYNAVLFSLSQSTECLLVAIVRLVIGYDINTHNLERLLIMTQMFTGEIYNSLELDKARNKKAFAALKQAYVDVRYKDSFVADAEMVATAYQMVKQLIAVTENIYRDHLLTNSL